VDNDGDPPRNSTFTHALEPGHQMPHPSSSSKDTIRAGVPLMFSVETSYPGWPAYRVTGSLNGPSSTNIVKPPPLNVVALESRFWTSAGTM